MILSFNNLVNYIAFCMLIIVELFTVIQISILDILFEKG